jgi:hypothetical protein
MKVLLRLVSNLKYFQGKPHVRWYSMNKNELQDAKMVVGVPEVHVFNIETYLVNPPHKLCNNHWLDWHK